MSGNTPDARAARLDAINAALAARNLKPLEAIGNAEHGQIELLEIIEFFDHSSRFFTDVMFSCRFPGGVEGRFTIRWNANSLIADGAVMVVLVNGTRIAMVRQFRPVLGTWTTELPRGFGETIDNAKVHGRLGTVQIGDLPLGNALRELGEEVMESARVVSVQHLGNIAENSGTHTTTPSYWVIEISVDPELLKRRLDEYTEEGLALQLWTYRKTVAEIGFKICDAHSIVALALFRAHLDRMTALEQGRMALGH